MAYSRQFLHNTTGDELNHPSTTIHFKTSFIKEKVVEFLDLLEAQHTLEKITLTVEIHPIFEKDTFVLNAFDPKGSLLEKLVGDFPCPDQCVPPLTEAFKNAFEVEHVREAMNYNYCAYLTARFAKLRDGAQLFESSSIYGVVSVNGNLVEKIGINDNVYISLT